MTQFPGLFIVLEGPSGSGKSTINAALSAELTKEGYNVISTREPTDKFNRNDENTKSGHSLYELFLKDRKDHVQNEIIPSLASDKAIICDRYIPSTLTYQCIEGVSFDKVYNDNINFPIPDLTIFLEVSLAKLTQRVSERTELTRFEKSDFRIAEIEQYGIVKQKLEQEKDWNVVSINNDIFTVEQVVELIMLRI
jgi:dTMP kinase